MGDLSKDISSKFESNKLKALINIVYTANWIKDYQNKYFKAYGISPQQYNILRILRGANQALKVQTIKDRMIERAPNATRLMDKLCAKHLIVRTHSEDDRRIVKIAITDKGLELLRKIPDNFNIKLIENLSEEEAGQLSHLLDKMR